MTQLFFMFLSILNYILCTILFDRKKTKIICYVTIEFLTAEGKGTVNHLGVKFYNNLINEIISNGKADLFFFFCICNYCIDIRTCEIVYIFCNLFSHFLNFLEFSFSHFIFFFLPGLIPFVTLFHWDFPQALEDEYGGFRSHKVV